MKEGRFLGSASQQALMRLRRLVGQLLGMTGRWPSSTTANTSFSRLGRSAKTRSCVNISHRHMPKLYTSHFSSYVPIKTSGAM